jgi:hypothetical protein
MARLKYYQQKLSHYQVWLCKADQFLEASKILKPVVENKIELCRKRFFTGKPNAGDVFPSGLLEVYFLLIGIVMENLLKAKWVKKNRRGLKNEILTVSRLPRELQTHNLLPLAGKVGLKLDANENELLNRLSEYVKWAARYPVPVESKDLKPRFLSGSDLHKLNNLVLEVNRQLWRKHSS